ncbi:MAG: NusG domain II-containing protein [Actinobacteria bacterium]|nr:NusG domain II-containing protein [Actinomycetota bacterium]
MLTRYDKILLFILVLSVFLSLPVLRYIAEAPSKSKEIIIYYQGKELKRFTDASNEKKLKIGGCLIEIKKGKARVASSTCPDKICVSYGWIENPSQSIVCLPHRVLIKIEGGSIRESEYDFISR